MSKAKVSEAIRRWADGDQAAAAALLANVAPEFVRKRLRHLISTGSEGDAALALWDAVVGAERPAVGKPTQAGPRPLSPAEIDELPLITMPSAVFLDRPESFLQPLPDEGPFRIDLEAIDVLQVWALVGLAALSRRNGRPTAHIASRAEAGAARFARALGLEDVIAGTSAGVTAEPRRTVKLDRIQRYDQIERAAARIARLIFQDDEESRRTLQYVVIELLRNAVQHSEDPLGGVVAAQLMDQYQRPAVQVAVADAGIGVQRALSTHHPDVSDAGEALEKAIQPHISGTFHEGRTGSLQNAGMGLFFISEMAKLTAGRLVIASRGATLSLQGDLQGLEQHRLSLLQPKGTGFPGTLVAFELPVDEVQDHDALLESVRQRARDRLPGRQTGELIVYEHPPPGVPLLLVRVFAEDTSIAERKAAEELKPRIVREEAVAFDFEGIDVCTQSFLHSLLYQVLRLAWALGVPIYVVNTSPAVRSGLALVEGYALRG